MQQELNDLTSPVGAFVRQRCDVGPGLRVPRDALYTAYQAWCRSEGMLHVSNRVSSAATCGRPVAALGAGQLHDHTRVHTGIALRAAGSWAPPHVPPMFAKHPGAVRAHAEPHIVNESCDGDGTAPCRPTSPHDPPQDDLTQNVPNSSGNRGEPQDAPG